VAKLGNIASYQGRGLGASDSCDFGIELRDGSADLLPVRNFFRATSCGIGSKRQYANGEIVFEHGFGGGFNAAASPAQRAAEALP
jgi:hypothetical protein